MDITLDKMLTILDEHYNNVKALDALNQELFQLSMADKETVFDWGVHLSRQLQVLVASFPHHFPPDHVAELKQGCFYGRLPKRLKEMVAYLKASLQKKTYSNYLQTVREAEKEESMDLSWNQWSHVVDNTLNQKLLVSSLKGNQSVSEMATVCLVHLEEESAEKDKEVEIEDPDSLNGVTEEFVVHLVWAIKDVQVEEKCCYHCSSPEHFILDCPLVRASRENAQLNCKEGIALRKGSWTPQVKMTVPKNPQEEVPRV